MKDLKTAGGICLAAVLWAIMFSPWTAPHINFWFMMTLSAISLTAFTTWASPRWWKSVRLGKTDITCGILLAAALWGIFWLGDIISSTIFDFARGQVDSIYGMKDGENPWLLSILLLFIIGPAEEIFWRGYVQKTLSERWNPNWGFLVTTLIYSLVHLPKMNFMLIMAAAVAGFFWGLAYRFFPNRLGALIISHALWDCAIFIWLPI